jgi:hypothetical protein
MKCLFFHQLTISFPPFLHSCKEIFISAEAKEMTTGRGGEVYEQKIRGTFHCFENDLIGPSLQWELWWEVPYTQLPESRGDLLQETGHYNHGNSN